MLCMQSGASVSKGEVAWAEMMARRGSTRGLIPFSRVKLPFQRCSCPFAALVPVVISLGVVLSGGSRAPAQDGGPPEVTEAPVTQAPTSTESNSAAPERAEAADAGEAETSSPEALAAYAKAATLQNNGAFDLAAEAWENFLGQYAADAKAVEARYNLGVCQLELKDFEQARASLQAAIAGGVEFPRREDAHLNLGWALYTLALQNQPARFAEAEQAFTQLLETYPQGQYRDQALFLRGESLYLQGKRDEAVKSYAQLLDEFKETELLPNALYAMGVTYEELGKPAEAGAAYDRYLEGFADQPLATEVRMRRAETILQSGDFAEAERRFAEVAEVADFANVDHARYRQAFCLARQDRFGEAADRFAEIPARFPQSRYVTDATIAAARAYFRAERYADAKTWFDKLLTSEGPYATEAAHWRARLMLMDKDAAGALALIGQHLPAARAGKHPFLVNLSMDEADALYELPDRRDAAVAAYLKLVHEFPDHLLAAQAQYNAAFGTLELKDYAQGAALAERFVTRFPNHRLLPDVKRVLAECKLQLGDSAAAAETLSELAEAAPSDLESAQLQLRQAVALFMQKKFKETLAQVAENLPQLQTPDEQAEAHYLMGMSHLGLLDYEPARVALSRSLELQPKWRQADETLLSLSRAQRKLKDLDGAKASIERLLREFPATQLADQAYFRLAEYCYALSDFSAAVQHYEHVVRDWPESSFAIYAYYGLGWAQLKSGNLPAAQGAFEELLGANPDHALAPQAEYALSMALQQAGKYDQALSQLDAYLKRDLGQHEKSDALYVRGLCFVGKKELPAAIESLQRVVQTDPDYQANDKVLYELGWAYKGSQQQPQALESFRQLAERFPQSSLAAEAFYHLAEDAYERRDYAAAAPAYDAARTRLAQDADLGEKVRYKAGWAAYQLQDYPAALAAFEEQLQHHPQSALAGDALFMQGECHFKQKNFASALESYQAARDRKLSSEQIVTLTYLHAGQAAGQLEQWEASRDWLIALAQKFPQSPMLLSIGFELAVAQHKLGNAAEAERLFASVAERAAGELGARGRFMLGEVLFAKRDYAAAIREFRKLMFGFDERAPVEVRRLQAKAGIEAGQCAGVLASQEANRRERQQYIDLAVRCFQYVQTRHPTTDEAKTAAEQLKKYGA